MSEYGIRIKNIEAASIYEYKYGFRNNLDQTNAMLVNSLFLDFLLKEKLIRIHKEESTRDIICVEFGYGTKDYNTALSKINTNLKKDSLTDKARVHLESIRDSIETNKMYCKKISKENLRVKYYTEGFDITYKTFNKSGEELIDKRETISYKMLYRTPGKAKKGTCMFINTDYYDKVHDFLYMGIHLPEKNAPIVEMGAYSSLITSSVIGRIQILPEQILVVDDVEVPWDTNVLTVGIDKDKRCTIEAKENYSIINTLFDGQALIDSSIFPDYADGYILLRHHMTKMAAFNSNIQLFMKDTFGDEYETKTVKDRFGRTVRVKDIRLITTENALKWLKFNISFDGWAEWVRKNDCMFGIVKTTHPSKLGDVQRMSYQMVNALDLDSIPSVCEKTINYINDLKNSNNIAFLDYLEKNKNFSNDYEVLLALQEYNKNFVKSSYFRRRKSDIISAYVLNFKSGHGIQNADNLTIVGSPYAMLLRSVGKSVYDDPTFSEETGCIQCYTERFENGAYLAEFRNPFNSRNNLGYMHNVYHEYFGRYFCFGRLVIAVNMIKTDFQDRNNGSDQDSDSIYVTDQADIVKHAKYCYINYPTIVNKIPKDKNVYSYSMKDFAEVDNKLAAAQLAIGESSNLAQICLTYTYNFEDQKYQDYVCILSVLAQVAIDNAKRKFDIDLNKEIARIKSDMDIDKNGLPNFWLITKKDKRKARNDKIRQERQKKNKEKIKERIKELKCPMNIVYDMSFDKANSEEETIPMDKFWKKYENIYSWRKSKKIEQLIQDFSIDLYRYNVWEDEDLDKYILLKDDYDRLIKEIRKLNKSKNNIGLFSWLINRAFLIGAGVRSKKEKLLATTNKNRALLLKVLYDIDKRSFLQCFCNND